MTMTTTSLPARRGAIALTLQAEGAAIAAAAIYVYAQTGGSWMFFALLILLPDLSMLGYLKDNRLGAVCYNVAHSYLAPMMLGGIGMVTASGLLMQLALIWVAHIGMDRAIGYGLKYAAGFKTTHLDRL